MVHASFMLGYDVGHAWLECSWFFVALCNMTAIVISNERNSTKHDETLTVIPSLFHSHISKLL